MVVLLPKQCIGTRQQRREKNASHTDGKEHVSCAPIHESATAQLMRFDLITRLRPRPGAGNARLQSPRALEPPAHRPAPPLFHRTLMDCEKTNGLTRRATCGMLPDS